MLETSIFFFSENIFYSSQSKFLLFILLSANTFNLDQSKILLLGKEIIVLDPIAIMFFKQLTMKGFFRSAQGLPNVASNTCIFDVLGFIFTHNYSPKVL